MLAHKDKQPLLSVVDVDKLVYADQMELLYRSLGSSMLISVVLAGLWLAMIPGFDSSPYPQWWYIIFVLVALARIYLAVLFSRYRDKFSCRQWEVWFIASGVVTAILWAVGMAWAFPRLDVTHQALMLLFLAGLHMGALSSVAARPLPMPTFVLITAQPLLWQWTESYNQLPNVALVMFVFYWVVIAGNARRLYSATLKNFRLSHESRQSEQRFRSMVDSAGDALIVINQQGKIVDANRTANSMTGYSREQLVGMRFRQVGDVPSSQFFNKLRRLKRGEVLVEQTTYRNALGEEVPVSVSETLYSFDGNNYIVVVARDLSIQQLQQQELLHSRTKLDLHISKTPLAVIDWDQDFKVVSWNLGAERIFGYQAQEIIGHHAYGTIVDVSLTEQINEIWQQLMDDAGGYRSMGANLTKDGREIFCDWYNTPLLDHAGKVVGVASLVMDITDRVKIQREILAEKKKAEAANASKTKFLSRMSHELRTPLNAIIGFSALLRKEGANETFVNAIEASGQQLLAMINEVLDLSRLEQGKLKLYLRDVMLVDVVHEAVMAMTPMAKAKNIQIDVCDNCLLLEVFADRACLRQVLINLLSNAVKFSDNHSSIYLRANRLDDYVRLEVEDVGCGIPKNKQHLLFNEFERAGAEETNVSGTGIGLMISRHMIEEMGGEIGFESEEGKGSCFWLMLPTQKADAASLSLVDN
ncbi:MAG: PAS domain S-box protein [Gammaproteobacteria bacterium]|nr:PAS domain S-box protein [Gammaproteobacteria bacterium]